MTFSLNIARSWHVTASRGLINKSFAFTWSCKPDACNVCAITCYGIYDTV